MTFFLASERWSSPRQTSGSSRGSPLIATSTEPGATSRAADSGCASVSRTSFAAPSVPQTSFSDVRDVTRGQASSRMRLPLEPEGEEEATTVQVV